MKPPSELAIATIVSIILETMRQELFNLLNSIQFDSSGISNNCAIKLFI